MSRESRYLARVQHALALAKAENARLVSAIKAMSQELTIAKAQLHATIQGNNSLAARMGLSQRTVDEMRARIKDEILKSKGEGQNGGTIV